MFAFICCSIFVVCLFVHQVELIISASISEGNSKLIELVLMIITLRWYDDDDDDDAGGDGDNDNVGGEWFRVKKCFSWVSHLVQILNLGSWSLQCITEATKKLWVIFCFALRSFYCYYWLDLFNVLQRMQNLFGSFWFLLWHLSLLLTNTDLISPLMTCRS